MPQYTRETFVPVIGKNVYVKKSQFYNETIKHEAMFKSRVESIDEEKGTFTLKGIKSSSKKYRLDIIFYKEMPEWKETHDYPYNNSYDQTIKYDILEVNDATSKIYQKRGRNFTKLSDKIRKYLGDLELKMEADTTKNLMHRLHSIQKTGLWSNMDSREYDLVRKVLNTREHFPNKNEAKIERRNKSQGKG